MNIFHFNEGNIDILNIQLQLNNFFDMFKKIKTETNTGFTLQLFHDEQATLIIHYYKQKRHIFGMTKIRKHLRKVNISDDKLNRESQFYG